MELMKGFHPDVTTASEESLTSLWSQARENTIKYFNSISDKERPVKSYKVGDLVFLENKNAIRRKKRGALRDRPFKVLDRVSSTSYRIAKPSRIDIYKFVHVALLKSTTNSYNKVRTQVSLFQAHKPPSRYSI